MTSLLLPRTISLSQLSTFIYIELLRAALPISAPQQTTRDITQHLCAQILGSNSVEFLFFFFFIIVPSALTGQHCYSVTQIRTRGGCL